MRRLAEESRIRTFMSRLGSAGRAETRIYFTGGATAVLMGWRTSTIDVDLQMVPENDSLMRLLPEIKESLEMNIELAAPSHFIPELPGWVDRSIFIAREGSVSFYHYDFYSQALAKIERGHSQDRSDVEAMLSHGLVEPARLRELFDAILSQIYRYPAIDPASMRRALDEALAGRGTP